MRGPRNDFRGIGGLGVQRRAKLHGGVTRCERNVVTDTGLNWNGTDCTISHRVVLLGLGKYFFSDRRLTLDPVLFIGPGGFSVFRAVLVEFFVGVGERAVGTPGAATSKRQIAAHADFVFGVLRV